MNTKYKFYLLEIATEGPNRIEGAKGYPTKASARLAAERFLREYPHRRVTVVETHETMWVDPVPALLNDLAADMSKPVDPA